MSETTTKRVGSGRLAGEPVVVTAAAQGIGKATALLFASEGARVFAVDIQEDRLAALAQAEAAIEPCPLDVTDTAGIRRLVTDLPTPRVLVNCVGWVHHGNILDCDEDAWERSIRINVTPMYHLTRAFLPAMIDAHYGSIINISSVASSVIGAPNRFAYGTTKAAVIGLTKSVAVDFIDRGVRCNAICPGTVESPSLDQRIAAFDDPEAARRAFIARQPMGRLGKAEEVAALALHLASPESAYTTGSIHVIDGGMSL